MKKVIKTVILIVISFLNLESSYGQIQRDMVEYLKQKFIMYTEVVPREEIYFHSDRLEYIAGEDLWFNLYLIDRKSFKPSLNSKIAYLELLNSENRPVVQRRIRFDKGFGPGQIVLPDTLSTGSYTLRAYTSWMKNFLPSNCFTQEISVYNTLKQNDSKTELSTTHYIKEGTRTKRIFNINENLVNLRVNNTKPDTLELFVGTDNSYRSENNNLIYLFIQTHGNINYISSEKLSEKITKISIPKNLLSAGINQITIFNSKAEPLCEKYIYTPLREKNKLILHSADSCSPRNKIILGIEPENALSGSFASGNISISVTPEADFKGMKGIDEYMIFGTEYGTLNLNNIKSFSFNDLSPEKQDSILLDIRSNWINWPTILSDNLPLYKYKFEKDYYLLLGRLLTSDQQKSSSGKTILMCSPGKNAVFQYAITDYEGNFNFNINIDDELKDLIMMPDNPIENQKLIIESSFSDLYPQPESAIDSIHSQLPQYILKWNVNYQVRTIFGYSAMGNSLGSTVPIPEKQRFYGNPDIGLIMADFILLPTMEEVFFELMPHISLKKRKSEYEITITDWIDNSPYNTSPCLMIDGVIIKDPSLIASLDPEIVEKIDVIKEKYLVGQYYFPGIVNIITKSGDFSCVTISDYMIRLPFRVIDPVWSFVSPDYSLEETKSRRIPDYRTTLYWNPNVNPGRDGRVTVEFWSSDNKSDYIINIQGITQDGRAFSAIKNIKIK